MKTLSLPNNYKESMTVKYRSKAREDETKNVNNQNKHFDKLRETHLEEQDSSEIDNLLKYAEKTTTNKNRQIHCNYQKMTITSSSDYATAIPEDQKCTTHPRGNRYLKIRAVFTPTPKQNIAELENDIFQFTRKLHLTYH